MAVQLSDHDTKMLGLAMQCIKGGGKPDIDYNKLMALAGHTNPGSTKNKMAQIFKKLDSGPADGEDNTPVAPSKGTRAAASTKPSSSKRKAENATASDAPGSESEQAAPASSKKPRGRSKTTKKQPDTDETATGAPASKTPSKKTAQTPKNSEAVPAPVVTRGSGPSAAAKKDATMNKADDGYTFAEQTGTAKKPGKKEPGQIVTPSTGSESEETPAPNPVATAKNISSKTPSNLAAESSEETPATPGAKRSTRSASRGATPGRSTRGRPGSATPAGNKKGSKGAGAGKGMEKIKEEEDDEQDSGEIAV